jgi:hypothetical protein
LTANQTTGLGYQSYLRSTISLLKSRGITKIIIDVTGNPGGAIVLGFETFKQFFPQNEPFATTNMRATDTAKLFYEFTDERMRDNSSAGAAVRVALDSSPFDFRFQRDPQGNYYTNVKDAYGPVVSHGDTFTNFQKWDLHGGFTFNWPAFEITNNDETRDENARAPWPAEDIVVLTDGTCASTCTLFAEAMKEFQVKTFVYGGRHRPGPMQATGGAEGSQSYPIGAIALVAGIVMEANPGNETLR